MPDVQRHDDGQHIGQEEVPLVHLRQQERHRQHQSGRQDDDLPGGQRTAAQPGEHAGDRDHHRSRGEPQVLPDGGRARRTH